MDVLVNGRRAHAGTGGVTPDPSKPAVVMVHGAGMDRTVWQLQTRRIAHAGFAAYALDLPGHGNSEGDALTSIADMADWVAAFLEAADLSDVCLVGHSMGSLITLEVAARHGSKLRSAILMGTADTMPVHPDLIDAAADGQVLAAQLITDWAHGAGAHRGAHPQPGLWVLGAAERLITRARPGVLANDLRACNAYQDASARASDISIPVTIIAGREDKMTPAKRGAALASGIAGAAAITLAGAGHMMMVEAPDATFDAMKVGF